MLQDSHVLVGWFVKWGLDRCCRCVCCAGGVCHCHFGWRGGHVSINIVVEAFAMIVVADVVVQSFVRNLGAEKWRRMGEKKSLVVGGN